MNNILEVEGLSRSYGKFNLSDVSFSLPEDCITGFIGVNGAGKTTTIKSILQLISRDSGRIIFKGKEVGRDEREFKNKIGFVLDSGGLYGDLRVEEMKRIAASAYKYWCEEDYKRYMDCFGLSPKSKISTLSKGMKMKLALALALSHKAELLIMDEPTDGLDPVVRGQFLDLLKDYIKEEGRSVLFSTHITSDLDKAADKIVLINDGKIIFEKEKDMLLDEYRVVKGKISDLQADMVNNEKLFINLQTSSYSFRGLTSRADEVRKVMSEAVFQRPSIEDVMVDYIEGGVC